MVFLLFFNVFLMMDYLLYLIISEKCQMNKEYPNLYDCGGLAVTNTAADKLNSGCINECVTPNNEVYVMA